MFNYSCLPDSTEVEEKPNVKDEKETEEKSNVKDEKETASDGNEPLIADVKDKVVNEDETKSSAAHNDLSEAEGESSPKKDTDSVISVKRDEYDSDTDTETGADNVEYETDQEKSETVTNKEIKDEEIKDEEIKDEEEDIDISRTKGVKVETEGKDDSVESKTENLEEDKDGIKKEIKEESDMNNAEPDEVSN